MMLVNQNTLERLFKDLRRMRIDAGDYRKLKKMYLGEPMHKLGSDGRYLCIKACGITKSKCTRIRKKVTCKNCLRLLRKRTPNKTKKSKK